jgi:opacity protein-like surface antigen
MKLSLKAITLFSGLLSGLSVAVMATAPASAQPVSFDGSYIGAGITSGVTSGGTPGGDTSRFGGNVQGRFGLAPLVKAPVSLRSSVAFTNKNSAITVAPSYDVRLNDKTNVYGLAGYTFVQNKGVESQNGNQSSPVVGIGIESQVAKGVVVYGDAKYNIKAYQANSNPNINLTTGVGITF